jgi:protein tyrosine phosphatase (PTP) superfamily phosphohydrolase (DUF442 family)
MGLPTRTSNLQTPRRDGAALVRATITGALLGTLLACAVEIGRMISDRNKHEVIPGRVYRSAQLTPEQLKQFVARHKIKTVINLRGRPFNDWYPAQSKATQELGISQEDVTTSASRLPPTGEVRRLVEIFDQCEYPILMHCQQGADRTGLATASYLLLHTDADLAAARRHCSPRFGHVPIHTAAAMQEFFDQYEEWLRERGTGHSSAMFRQWATSEYCPGPGRAKLEWLSAAECVEVGKPVVFTVRAHNTSRATWRFTAGSRIGIHASYVVINSKGQVHYSGKAGFLDATVPPGEFIDLALPVPAPASAGRFVTFIDLSDRNVSFTQYGSEPLTHDWEAREASPVRGR